MPLLYLGKYSLGTLKVRLYFDKSELVIVSVLSDGASAVIQAFKKLVLAPSHLRKGLDLAQVQTLASSHSANLEVFATAPSTDLALKFEPFRHPKAGWLEYGLRKVEEELEREKAEYHKFRGVRDIDEAEDNLRNRREEIFDLDQKLIANVKEPQFVYDPKDWIPSAWQQTDRLRFRELKDQAQSKASAIRQRIDFTFRQRIKELEEKRRDLLSEIEAEKKREKEHGADVAKMAEEGKAVSVVFTIRSKALVTKGRRRHLVLQAAEEVSRDAKAFSSKVSERLGLKLVRPELPVALSPIFAIDASQLHKEAPELAKSFEKALSLAPRDALQKQVVQALSVILDSTARSVSPPPPDLSRFPTLDGADRRRLAYFGLALREDLTVTELPVLYDLDEQGPRHTTVAGGSGSGKSVAASLIVEGAARYGIPCLILDPTRSWTGLGLPCSQEALLSRYPAFQMNREWARGYEIRIVEISHDGVRRLPIESFISLSGINVLAASELTAEQESAVLANLLRKLSNEIKDWPESNSLRLLVVLEEAHRYLQDRGLEELLELFARTARVRGVGLLIVSQNVTDIPPAIRNNVATKIQLQTAYAQDLTRAGQVFGQSVQKLVPRFERGNGALFFPEYGQALVAFRPPLHSPEAMPEYVEAYYSSLTEMKEMLTELLTRQPQGNTASQVQTSEEPSAEVKRHDSTQTWRDVATRVATGGAANTTTVVDEIRKAGLQPPSLRTLQRFLKQNRN